MKISKKVLNTEFAGSPQSVKALSEDTACGDRVPLDQHPKQEERVLYYA